MRLREFSGKAGRQVAKDYLAFPALTALSPGATFASTCKANAIANIIRNALEHMRPGSSLVVRTRMLQEHSPRRVGLEVINTGSSIAEEDLEKIFEPFYSTRPSGMGLGLAITAHAVQLLGGKIEVDTKVGVGSTFRLLLPRR